jgi:hypothetical protein
MSFWNLFSWARNSCICHYKDEAPTGSRAKFTLASKARQAAKLCVGQRQTHGVAVPSCRSLQRGARPSVRLFGRGEPPKKIRPSGFRSPQRPGFEWGAKPRIPDQPFGRGQPLPQQSRKRLENGLVSPRDTRMFSIDANAATEGGSRGKRGITARSPPAGRKGLPATGGMRGCREQSDGSTPPGVSALPAPRRRGASHEGHVPSICECF